MRAGGLGPQNGPYSCPAVEILRKRKIAFINAQLIDVQPNMNMQGPGWPYSILPSKDSAVTDCLHKHEEEYILKSPSAYRTGRAHLGVPQHRKVPGSPGLSCNPLVNGWCGHSYSWVGRGLGNQGWSEALTVTSAAGSHTALRKNTNGSKHLIIHICSCSSYKAVVM